MNSFHNRPEMNRTMTLGKTLHPRSRTGESNYKSRGREGGSTELANPLKIKSIPKYKKISFSFHERSFDSAIAEISTKCLRTVVRSYIKTSG